MFYVNIFIYIFLKAFLIITNFFEYDVTIIFIEPFEVVLWIKLVDDTFLLPEIDLEQ